MTSRHIVRSSSLALRRAGWLALVLAAPWAGGCSQPPETDRDADAAAPASSAEAGRGGTDQEISRLVAEMADLRTEIDAAESARAALFDTIEQHQLQGQAELDALMQEVAAANDPEDSVPDRPLEELAYEADEAFKQRAQEILEPALERDLELQRRLAAANAEIETLRSTLAEKEQALAALTAPDQ